MQLEPATTLGAYTVTAKIGEGGMGEVYRARDTKLDRDVALKVLPEAFTADPDRLARFEREAKVLASLNHPNIGHIYGFEETGDIKALVLELIEGPTLADRIDEGPMAIDDVLPIAKQIAEALEAAHEQGIIHRDLKPANVKVKADGTVKVLDFGLAKAFQPEASGASASESPTISLTAAATQMGMVIGTAAYMAPEQAKGLPVDKRADIWAYGAVLFEMLTGKKLFDAGDVSEVLASVLVKDPDISSLGSHVPACLRSVIRRCLVKNPKDRLRDIGDVRLVMEGAFETTGDTRVDPGAERTLRAWRRPVPAVIGVLAVATVSGLAVWGVMRSAPEASTPPTRASVSLPTTDRFANLGLDLSPDGRDLVYVAIRDGVPQLFRRSMGQLDPVPVPGTEGATWPFFSPDGASVGFFAEGALKAVALAGGTPQTVCPAPRPFGASWGHDGTIVFGGIELQQVSATGGLPQPISTPRNSEGELFHTRPSILPGGGGLLFTINTGPLSAPRIAVYSFVSGEHTSLVEGSSPRYVSTGHIIFGRAGSLWAVPFDPELLALTGEPTPLIEDVQVTGGTSELISFSVADDGTLVYVPSTFVELRSLVWVDRNGTEEPLSGAMPDEYLSLRLSPDGTRVALDIIDGETGTRDIWVHDAVRGTRQRLTDHPASDLSPMWSLDGERVLFGSNRDGVLGAYAVNADGTGEVERLFVDEDATVYVGPEDWSPDGTKLVFIGFYPDGRFFDIGMLSVSGEPRAELLVQEASIEYLPRISTNGRWFAYTSTRTGREDVYAERFPGLGDRQPISPAGGHQPEWSPDGRELFYVTLDGTRLMSVPVRADETLGAGPPEVVVEMSRPIPVGGGFSTYDVTPEGDRFLMVKPTTSPATGAGPADLIVVQGWFEELKERVPVP